MYSTEDERSIHEWTDEEVLAASVDDPDLFVHLVRRYEAPFLRKARKVLYAQEDVEDVVHTVRQTLVVLGRELGGALHVALYLAVLRERGVHEDGVAPALEARSLYPLETVGV